MKSIAFCAVAAIAFTNVPARAQEAGVSTTPSTTPTLSPFARAGTVAIGIDRAFGVYSDAVTAEGTPTGTSTKIEVEEKSTVVSFIWGSSTAPSSGGANVIPGAIPRAVIDFFPTDGFSLGGTLGILSGSWEGNVKSPVSGPIGEADLSGFVVGTRVGYAAMFTPQVGLWPRGGVTYTKATVTTKDYSATNIGEQTDEDEIESSLTHVTLEGMLVVTPFDHVAFVVGPVLEIPLSGEQKVTDKDFNPSSQTQTDYDTTEKTYGAAVGLLAYF